MIPPPAVASRAATAPLRAPLDPSACSPDQAAIRDGEQTQLPQIQSPDQGNHDWRAPASSWPAAPEFDKGTLARTLIGLYGQVTSLPDRPDSLRVLAPTVTYRAWCFARYPP